MNEMLTKLAEIADFADESGQYEIAEQTTKLFKEAQLWDAIKTLFDPEHTPGLDRNTPFWKRLTKGFQRGKLDRNVGLVLALMTERTKLNEKIKTITAPIKEFQQDVTAFYDKLHSGQMKAEDFKQESRNLQKGLKETLNLITGKDLRNILKMRERLEEQQQVAAEKIKGLDDETKSNLMAVLRGESLPGTMPQTPEQQAAGPENRFRSWLRKFNLPRMSMYMGAETPSGKHNFREFMEEYGYHPKAVYDFFANNANAQAEGFDRFGKQFGEMLRRAPSIMDADKRIAEENRRSAEEGAKQEATQQTKKKDEAHTEPMITPPVTTAPAPSQTPEDEQKAAERARWAQEERRKAEERVRAKDLLKAIEDKYKPRPASPIPAAPLATSKAERIGREITRLGRVRQLGKLDE